jgi:hypothetical protein
MGVWVPAGNMTFQEETEICMKLFGEEIISDIGIIEPIFWEVAHSLVLGYFNAQWRKFSNICKNKDKIKEKLDKAWDGECMDTKSCIVSLLMTKTRPNAARIKGYSCSTPGTT